MRTFVRQFASATNLSTNYSKAMQLSLQSCLLNLFLNSEVFLTKRHKLLLFSVLHRKGKWVALRKRMPVNRKSAKSTDFRFCCFWCILGCNATYYNLIAKKMGNWGHAYLIKLLLQFPSFQCYTGRENRYRYGNGSRGTGNRIEKGSS